jgi:16S rRNA (cytosine967-C5)-methyltransferase
VEEGGFLDEAVHSSFSRRRVAESAKGLIYQVSSGAVRHKGYLDWVLSRLAERSLKKEVRYLLWMSLYQIFFMEKAPYHVVDEVVTFAKKERGQGVANFVNAVLRSCIRERDRIKLPVDPLSRLSVTYSFPRWLVKRWQQRFGTEKLESLLETLNSTPEFGLRIDLRRVTRETIMAGLRAEGLKVREGRYLESAVYVDRIAPILKSDLFDNHIVHVQDEASQMVALALSPAPGNLILDACAGQGTKADQVKEMCPEACIVAMDLDGKSLSSARRADFRVQGDVLENPFKNGVFDSILLDAPCSSIGIIRKHPEIKWRRSEKDVRAFGRLQLAMIRALTGNVRRGGHLVYSVCSFEPEETTQVMEQVEKEGAFIFEKPLPGIFGADTFVTTGPHSGTDGFFIAKLKRV